MNRTLDCLGHVHQALVAEMEHRGNDHGIEWVDRERFVVAVAANTWATAHGIERTVTVEDIERIEGRAVGHVDYASKLALYVAELVILGQDPRP